MLDTIEFEFEWKHTPFGDPNHTKYHWTKVYGPHLRRNIQLLSHENGKSIKVKGSLANYLQGHNVFGSNNVMELAFRAVSRALKTLHQPFDRSKLRRALRAARISRIDIACSWRLPEGISAPSILVPLTDALLRNQGFAAYDRETVFQLRGNRTSMRIYDKGRRVRKAIPRWAKKQLYAAKYLQGASRRLLRFEVEMPKGWLEANELSRIGDWSAKTARRVVSEKVDEILARAAFTKEPVSLIYEKLPPEARNFLVAWQHGCDPRKHCKSPTTLRKYRRMLLPYHIDILSKAPAPTLETEECARLFRESIVWYGFPKGARKSKCVSVRENQYP